MSSMPGINNGKQVMQDLHAQEEMLIRCKGECISRGKGFFVDKLESLLQGEPLDHKLSWVLFRNHPLTGSQAPVWR